MNIFERNIVFVAKSLNNFTRNFKPPPLPSDFVKITEVGPRDGLQNESKIVPTDVKIDFINRLSLCGFKSIEATSFVSPKWVPQMADNEEVMKSIDRNVLNTVRTSYSALVPNEQGFKAAISSKVNEIAIFGSASETFSQKNLNCSIKESLDRYKNIVAEAREREIRVRGYVSCVVGCPYEGPIKPIAVAKVVHEMMEMGVNEVSLGDTIGVGTGGSMRRMLLEVFEICSAEFLALHCHDTYGQALTNVFVGLDYDLRSFDSSVGGLGGCPYARGASGNLATEDLVYMLHGTGLKTGVSLTSVIDTGRFICNYLGRENMSKVTRAIGDRNIGDDKLNKMAGCNTI